jgi:hypothetical protein
MGLWAIPAMAGDLSIRLVEATNGEGVSSSGLEDVVEVLKRNLAYQNYTLAGEATVGLPAKGETRQLRNYTVVFSGPKDNLSITVKQGSKRLLATTVKIESGTPLILGGFPSKTGKMVLVFVAE